MNARAVSILSLFSLIAAIPTSARVLIYTGECAGMFNSNWGVIITVDDETGAVTRREGADCDGRHWVGSCDIVRLPGTRGSGVNTMTAG